MATHVRSTIPMPALVGFLNPLASRLLRAGLPLGPNALLTVRGRKSGQPRTTPVAIVEVGGKRWVIGTFGEVNWVRNLRAAGSATITIGAREEKVAAAELSREEAARFFAEVLAPYVRGLRIGRSLLSLLGARDILDEPKLAAERRPVFELSPAPEMRS
jgi:deazaflavin-dependent oxidoreductase (nitroreductase family)